MDNITIDFNTVLLLLLGTLAIICISIFFFYISRRFLVGLGYATPVICMILLFLFFLIPYSEEDFMRAYRYFFNDNKAYYSCVGNPDHEAGIKDCTDLIAKLEAPQGIVLKDIPNTKGEYWLSEVVSYRGRHLIRMGKLDEGKKDFKRALLMEEGTAVTVNNLAEAGYTRQDAFQQEYDDSVGKLQASAICETVGLGLDEDVAVIINQQEAQLDEAAQLCRVTTGREAADCKQEMDGRLSDTRSRATLIYQHAAKDAVQMAFNNCKS